MLLKQQYINSANQLLDTHPLSSVWCTKSPRPSDADKKCYYYYVILLHYSQCGCDIGRASDLRLTGCGFESWLGTAT